MYAKVKFHPCLLTWHSTTLHDLVVTKWCNVVEFATFELPPDPDIIHDATDKRTNRISTESCGKKVRNKLSAQQLQNIAT